MQTDTILQLFAPFIQKETAKLSKELSNTSILAGYKIATAEKKHEQRSQTAMSHFLQLLCQICLYCSPLPYERAGITLYWGSKWRATG